MTKQKNGLLDLPPSGVQPWMSTGQSKQAPQEKRGCRNIVIGSVIVFIVLGIIGMFLPKSPAQIAQTQTAVAVALAASDIPKSPTKTVTATVTPYPDITMTATTPPTLDEEIASLKKLPAVNSVEQVVRSGTSYYAIVSTWPKFNDADFAQLLQIQAIQVDPHILRFAVRIDDGETEPLWWIDETSEWASSKKPPEWVDLKVEVSEVFTATLAAPATQLIHPKNCKTAVAQGLTAQQSAAEGLDRDQDGVACYGD